MPNLSDELDRSPDDVLDPAEPEPEPEDPDWPPDPNAPHLYDVTLGEWERRPTPGG